MIGKIDRNAARAKRRLRVRGKVSGTADAPRISVYRSVENIYAQVIDDTKGITLCASSTLDKALKESLQGKTKVEQAKMVGEDLAKKALAKGITKAVYDRGGYLYTGRVAALAEGARKGGSKF
ncbi:MAG: 50S ribosomal protein L18 [Clostridia bacterium]|nr:50S ribosomal protein L18 [Clostridia bacterium]